MTTSSLELAVLGLLKEGPMHGYELSKRLGAMFGMFRVVSFGSLYPCLRRLREAGFVEGDDEPKPVRRAKQDAKTSRRRQSYHLTGAGEQFFFEQLERGAAYDPDRFRTRLAFFRYLPREQRIGQLERWKVHLQERQDEFKESLRTAQDRMDSYGRKLIEHGMDVAESDIRWLQELIDQERNDPGAESLGSERQEG